MEKQWVEFITGFQTKELMAPDFNIVSVNKHDSVLDALKILTENKITSVPIYDYAAKKWTGFVDMLDIVAVILMLSEQKPLIDAIAMGEVSWQKYIDQELKVLKLSKVSEIVNASMRNPWCEVYEGFPLRSLMDMFGRDVNLHRVTVGNGDGTVLGIVSQSRVIQFFAENIDKFPNRINQKIRNLPQLQKNVHSINVRERALDAFETMIEKGVTGVAVVDDNNRLVGVVSASDLKGSVISNIFSDLYLPVGVYLEKSTSAFTKEKSLQPIACTLDSTLKDVVLGLAKNNVHRMFVKSEDGNPVGVFSLCDVISFLNHPPESVIPA